MFDQFTGQAGMPIGIWMALRRRSTLDSDVSPDRAFLRLPQTHQSASLEDPRGHLGLNPARHDDAEVNNPAATEGSFGARCLAR